MCRGRIRNYYRVVKGLGSLRCLINHLFLLSFYIYIYRSLLSREKNIEVQCSERGEQIHI